MSGIQQPYLGLEIIAEAGCNHGGNLDRALEMIRHAKTCGADTIKFQSFIPDKLVNPEEVLEWCKKSQLSYRDHAAIIDECEMVGINPLFSAFDLESLEMLATLGEHRVKIPSGQVFNQDLLAAAGNIMSNVYVSTGMCSMKDVRNAMDTLTSYGCNKEDIVLMQCTTCYPAPHEDANLLVIDRYMKDFIVPVGYSDHCLGYAAAIAAVALGATVIEKHFILNPKEETPDACVSLCPVEFRMMVNSLHEARAARGTHIKRPRQCEQKMLKRRDYGEKDELQ
ncbi:MAG: N-acetylneuraminate synthase family protein [Candidatus Thorarchaeota archaeon]|jgi:N,N'-diacetyllegionaminate synthase